MVMVNLGCGDTCHVDWVNLDASPSSPLVRHCDVRKGIPLATSSCDAVYHSHLLEHLDRQAGKDLLRECHRVLKPGGTCRVAVPDLERIAREYLRALEEARGGGDTRPYDWIMLELYDQTVRREEGGEMGRLFRAADPEQLALIEDRVGPVRRPASPEPAPSPSGTRLREAVEVRWRTVRSRAAEVAVRLLGGGPEFEHLHHGRFVDSGELHLWMYDSFSVGRLLECAGFEEVRVCDANDSRIPGFAEFGLEVVDERARKPDSVFLEAVRR